MSLNKTFSELKSKVPVLDQKLFLTYEPVTLKVLDQEVRGFKYSPWLSYKIPVFQDNDVELAPMRLGKALQAANAGKGAFGPQGFITYQRRYAPKFVKAVYFNYTTWFMKEHDICCSFYTTVRKQGNRKEIKVTKHSACSIEHVLDSFTIGSDSDLWFLVHEEQTDTIIQLIKLMIELRFGRVIELTKCKMCEKTRHPILPGIYPQDVR